jgi:hypothetical protein
MTETDWAEYWAEVSAEMVAKGFAPLDPDGWCECGEEGCTAPVKKK